MFPKSTPDSVYGTPTWLWVLLVNLALLSGCGSAPGRPEFKEVLSSIESDPAGASVFVDGGFVGTTPAKFRLPAKKRVELRIERPGYVFKEEVLLRKVGTPADAPAGVGWEPLYYYPLLKKGD